MTIATFCREQLLARGPLTADELGERAAAAGVTRSATPRNAVMSAMRGREVALADDTWVTPLWLLEGRCLTVSGLSLMGEDVDDTSAQDLGLLDVAARLQPLPLAGGGFLRKHGWNGWWKSSHPLPAVQPDEVLCFRVTGGELEVSAMPTAALDPVDPSFAAALNAAADRRVWSYPSNSGTAVLRRLAELLMEDSTLLRSPIPPLSTVVDAFAQQVAQRWEQQTQPYVDSWDTPDSCVWLSPVHAWRLRQLCDEEGLRPDEWVERQIDLRRRISLPPILWAVE